MKFDDNFKVRNNVIFERTQFNDTIDYLENHSYILFRSSVKRIAPGIGSQNDYLIILFYRLLY